MRWVLAVGLSACTATVPSDDVEDGTGDTDGDRVETGVPEVVERPAFGVPAEAADENDDPDVLEVTLTAAPATYEVGGRTVEGYAYDGQVPGPTLRARVGDTLVVHLENRLEVPTTIHWHGAGAPYAMDGVPWQRDPTAAGEDFTYTFELTEAGTFWYHPHFDTARQVDLGLYGVLVVEDPDEPTFDHDLVVVFDSWGESDDDPHQHAPEGSDLVWTVNGAVDPVWAPDAAGTVRWRLLNASNTGYVALDADGLQVLAGDQGVEVAPRQGGQVVLGPGDRAELGAVASGTWEAVSAPWSLHGGAAWGDPMRLWSVEARPGAATLPTFDVPSRAPTPDPGRTDVTYTLQGDGGSGAWRINHEAFPDVTIATVDVGDDVVIEVRNLSPTNHPFHGHGHAFEVLSIDGVPPDRYRVEDTLDVPVNGVVRLRYEATRAGDWMQHCHILPHADGGMMTVLRVLPTP